MYQDGSYDEQNLIKKKKDLEHALLAVAQVEKNLLGQEC